VAFGEYLAGAVILSAAEDLVGVAAIRNGTALIRLPGSGLREGLARAKGGGVMVWQLNQDAAGENSLLNAIFDAIKEPWRPF